MLVGYFYDFWVKIRLQTTAGVKNETKASKNGTNLSIFNQK
jgi:hypothetical protein